MVNGTDDWAYYEVPFTASNVTNANGRLRIQFIGLDDFYIDNVSLVPVTAAAANLDLGPYFDQLHQALRLRPSCDRITANRETLLSMKESGKL